MSADSILREKGIHLAVAKMRVGERCHVWVSPDYGYGAEGNFSFPAVPGNAALTYDVELLDFEPPADKEQRDMTFEERLEAAERRRVEGNAAFKAGQYTEALGRYSMSLSFIDEDLLMQLQGFHYDKAMATRTPALLNMAACHLKLGDNTAGISAASEVLMRDPDSAKALYRRGAARLALGQSEAAYEDLLRAWKLAPGDAGIAKELAAAKAALRQEREAEKRVFQGVLEKASNGGGLYEEKEGEDAEDSSWEETGAGGSWERRTLAGGSIKPQGWLSGVLQTLCPFIFGRQKQHVA